MLCEAKHSYDFSDNEVRVNLYVLIHLYKYNWYLGVYKGREKAEKTHCIGIFFLHLFYLHSSYKTLYSTYIVNNIKY